MAVIDNSGNYEYLLNKDVNYYLRAAYRKPGCRTGIPKYYALFDATTNASPPGITNELTFLLAPTPDAAYTVEMHYFHYPESITVLSASPTGTTWLGDNFELCPTLRGLGGSLHIHEG
jgi:hypothetical protein